jgi:putative transposase
MRAIKGKTSHHLLQDLEGCGRSSGVGNLWARRYFVCTSGNVTDEVIAQYIKLQGAEPDDDDRFRVSES